MTDVPVNEVIDNNWINIASIQSMSCCRPVLAITPAYNIGDVSLSLLDSRDVASFNEVTGGNTSYYKAPSDKQFKSAKEKLDVTKLLVKQLKRY